MELSDSEADFDRSSVAHPFRLVVARVNTSSEEEEEMALNPRRGLKDLVIGRKGSSSKDDPQTHLPPNPPLPTILSPFVESKEDPHGAKVRRQQCTWAPRLELDVAAIPWDASIRDF